jgi:hypothetical protein
VLGSIESLKAFNAGEMIKAKEVTLDNGKTIMVENAGFTETNRLIADYKKQHGLQARDRQTRSAFRDQGRHTVAALPRARVKNRIATFSTKISAISTRMPAHACCFCSG